MMIWQHADTEKITGRIVATNKNGGFRKKMLVQAVELLPKSEHCDYYKTRLKGENRKRMKNGVAIECNFRSSFFIPYSS